MTSAFFHTSKPALFSWVLTSIIVLAVMLVAGRQVFNWILMKLYEFFIQHK
jgi:hypothetical protein